jgi:DNA repair ATPase RecN
MTADALFQQDERLRRVERDQADMREVLGSLRESQQAISNSLERLVRLEERHIETREALGRAFDTIDKHAEALHGIRLAVPPNLEPRLRELENNMPGLLEMRRWMVAGVMSVVSLIGCGVIGLLIR